jgi:hypothetical protein
MSAGLAVGGTVRSLAGLHQFPPSTTAGAARGLYSDSSYLPQGKPASCAAMKRAPCGSDTPPGPETRGPGQESVAQEMETCCGSAVAGYPRLLLFRQVQTYIQGADLRLQAGGHAEAVPGASPAGRRLVRRGLSAGPLLSRHGSS